MKPVTIYTSSWCPYCVKALHLLDSKGVSYQNISVDGQPEVRQDMAEKAGRTSVPQIWIGDHHVGGCDELHALERDGQLDGILEI